MPLPKSGVRMRLATISKPSVMKPSVATSTTTSAAAPDRRQAGGEEVRRGSMLTDLARLFLLLVVPLDRLEIFDRREVVGERLALSS